MVTIVPRRAVKRKTIAKMPRPCLTISACGILVNQLIKLQRICAPAQDAERISRETMRLMRHSPTVSGFLASWSEWICSSLFEWETEFTRFLHDEGKTSAEREELVKKSSTRLRPMLGGTPLTWENLASRSKCNGSIYRKMVDKKKRFDEIHDLIADPASILDTLSDAHVAIHEPEANARRFIISYCQPEGHATSPSIRLFTVSKSD